MTKNENARHGMPSSRRVNMDTSTIYAAGCISFGRMGAARTLNIA